MAAVHAHVAASKAFVARAHLGSRVDFLYRQRASRPLAVVMQIGEARCPHAE